MLITEVFGENERRVFQPRPQNCVFKNESFDSVLFNQYSHSGCLFECLTLQSVQTCNCTPWNFPSNESKPTMCMGQDNLCFDREFNSASNIRKCNCLPDCNSTDYKYYVMKDKLQPSDICQSSTVVTTISQIIYKYIMNFTYDVAAVKFSTMMENFRKGEPFDWYGFRYPTDDICRARVTTDIAILEIFFGSQFVTQAEQVSISSTYYKLLFSSKILPTSFSVLMT